MAGDALRAGWAWFDGPPQHDDDEATEVARAFARSFEGPDGARATWRASEASSPR